MVVAAAATMMLAGCGATKTVTVTASSATASSSSTATVASGSVSTLSGGEVCTYSQVGEVTHCGFDSSSTATVATSVPANAVALLERQVRQTGARQFQATGHTTITDATCGNQGAGNYSCEMLYDYTRPNGARYAMSMTIPGTCSGNHCTVEWSQGADGRVVRQLTSVSSTTASASGQSFSGNGTLNLGTISVSQSSKLTWTCNQCAGAGGFSVVSSADPNGDIIDISSNANSGSSVVDPGSYPETDVITNGSWTIHIAPQS